MRLTKKIFSAYRLYKSQGFSAVTHVLTGKLLCRAARFFPVKWKEWNELDFWLKNKHTSRWRNSHYAFYFTDAMELDLNFYAGKRILDIGCGPMGSLEWADMTVERIGLDTLAKKYRVLGTRDHKMTYVASPSENIPFKDNYFDVVSSFNSLDHVADLTRSISEIQRILKPGGLFLLLTDVNHEPTDCEPQSFSWDIVDLFLPRFEVLLERHFKREDSPYSALKSAIAYDHANNSKQPGTLVVKLKKK